MAGMGQYLTMMTCVRCFGSSLGIALLGGHVQRVSRQAEPPSTWQGLRKFGGPFSVQMQGTMDVVDLPKRGSEARFLSLQCYSLRPPGLRAHLETRSRLGTCSGHVSDLPPARPVVAEKRDAMMI